MLVWMDLEMTGLEADRHVIVEIATLITDDDLVVVAEGPDLVVHATDEELAAMDDFVRDMHTGSGLLAEIQASELTLAEAGRQTLEFIEAHVPKPRTVPLAGNSIGTDRRFLAAHLPEIEEYLHYRSVDVSTIKELAGRWYPAAMAAAPHKSGGHRALDDIRESLAELAYYRTAVFRGPTPEVPAGGLRRDPSSRGAAMAEQTEGTVDTSEADIVPTRAEVTATLTAPGAAFEMEEVVIRDIPTRTWKTAPASLRAVFELSTLHGDKDFLVYEDERVTFEQHFRTVAALGHQLVDRFGVRPGDRVAIAMRNLPDWVMAFWATITVGAVAVPLNAWWTGDELAYGLADSGSKIAFVDEERQLRISHHLADVPGLEAMIVSCEEHDPDTGGRRPAVGCTLERTGTDPLHVIPFEEIVGTPADDIALPDVSVDPDDDATIFYTSGTTGRPKGAVGTHRNSCSNLMNLFFVATMGGVRRTRAQKEASPGLQNANLLSVPLFHATGCHALLVTNTAAGGKLVMMHHFDPERALELIERERITVFGGVPAMVMQVIDSPDFAKRDTSSVQSISYGGAPCPPDLVRRIKEHFPSGAPGNGYGLTETSAMTTMNSGDDYVRKPDSVGPPSPVCDVAVVPEEWDGVEPPADQAADPTRTGELWIKGPNVVRGYWNRPDATAASFTAGWLHTGDVARIDEEGFVHIVDRAKDMIIRGGENVYCVEIEGALHEHPAVADCAVIGVPHPVLSEEVGAVIVLRPGMDVAADELSRHVRERLAAFNVPSRYWFRAEALPRNPAGKILKRELRTELLGDAPVF